MLYNFLVKILLSLSALIFLSHKTYWNCNNHKIKILLIIIVINVLLILGTCI